MFQRWPSSELRGLAAAAVLLLTACGKPDLIEDEAHLLNEEERRRIAEFHGLLAKDYGIDYRVATVRDPGDIERAAVDRFAQLGIGGEGSGGYGLLLLVDPDGRRVRLEVGRALEGSFTDAFVTYVENRQMVPFFAAGRVADGILATTELIVQRAIEARASGDLLAGKGAALSAGAGATAAIDSNQGAIKARNGEGRAAGLQVEVRFPRPLSGQPHDGERKRLADRDEHGRHVRVSAERRADGEQDEPAAPPFVEPSQQRPGRHQHAEHHGGVAARVLREPDVVVRHTQNRCRRASLDPPRDRPAEQIQQRDAGDAEKRGRQPQRGRRLAENRHRQVRQHRIQRVMVVAGKPRDDVEERAADGFDERDDFVVPERRADAIKAQHGGDRRQRHKERQLSHRERTACVGSRTIGSDHRRIGTIYCRISSMRRARANHAPE